MRTFDQERLITLAELLRKLDKKIHKAGASTDTDKNDYNRLSELIEDALESKNSQASREIRTILLNKLADNRSNNPKLAKNLQKIINVCNELDL